MEDLWAFNDERVVRAIAASPIPVVSGVGHETDTTLADFAADLRAPTPTAAAELSSPSTADSQAMLAVVALAMRRRVHRVMETEAQRIDGLAMRSLRPLETVRRQLQTLDLWSHRLVSATTHATVARRQALRALAERFQRASGVPTQRAGQGLDRLEGRLCGLDPAGVLRRGYAWLSDESGRTLVSSSQLSVGQSVRAVLADGVAMARITSLTNSSD
jgi:exodeoxyribonuclease VII large subunit